MNLFVSTLMLSITVRFQTAVKVTVTPFREKRDEMLEEG